MARPLGERVRLRRYEHRDAAGVWRLHEHGLRPAGAHAGDGPWDDDLRLVTATYLDAGGEFLVGELGAEIVAMGGVRPLSRTLGEIRRMRVDARFRRRGLGRAVLRRLEARAQELGYARLRLDTTAAQVAAVRLFAAAGYVETERTGGRAGEEVIVLEKSLDM